MTGEINMHLIKAELLCDIAEQTSIEFLQTAKLADEPEETVYSLILQSIYRRVVAASSEGDYYVGIPMDLFMRAERSIKRAQSATGFMKRIHSQLASQQFKCEFALSSRLFIVSWG